MSTGHQSAGQYSDKFKSVNHCLQQIGQIWVLNTHTNMNFRTQIITQEEFYYPWSRTSNMSDPSVVIEPPDNNWRSDSRQTSQTSHSGHVSRRDQSRNKRESKKRMRQRSSSTSFSSRSASSDSRKRSRKSKISKQPHKKRRRRSTFSSSSSSSPSDNLSNDYGRY